MRVTEVRISRWPNLASEYSTRLILLGMNREDYKNLRKLERRKLRVKATWAATEEP
jgi:hypothetical protein